MKEKKTNTSQTKRDPWASLQSQLGLLSSPVEHEQLSIVAAVDARETAPQTENASPEVQNENDNDKIDMPFETMMEETIEAAIAPENKTDRDAAFDFGGFDFDDCDIPPNAFSKPKKPVAEPVELPPVVDSVDEKSFFDDEVFAQKTDIFEEIKPEKLEAEPDPFASDELPTALWQPRKPASIAKPVEKPAATSKPVRTESLSRPVAPAAKFEDTNREKKTETATSDDPPKHSSGNKRRERGGQRPQETSGSEQTSRERNDRGRNDRKRDDANTFDKPRSQEEKKPRSHRDSTEKKTFDDFGFDDDLVVDDIGFGKKGDFGNRGPKKGGDQNKSGFGGNLDNGFDDIADFSPKPGFAEQSPSKRRGQKPDKAPYSSEADEMSFEDFENAAKSKFRAGQNDNANGLDFEDNWFKKEDKPEESRERFPKRRDDRKDRKPRPNADAPRRDDRAAFSEVEEAPADRSRRKPRQPSGTRQETGPAPVAPQKIAVPNWDDAIGGIIERNMERRPAKNDRDRDRNKGNNRGGGRRR